MNLRNEMPGRTAERFNAAVVAERRAAACDRDLARHFEERNLGSLASLCRRLATRHEDAVDALRRAGADLRGPAPWLEGEARDFVLRVAGPRQLLEVALAAESEAERLYDDLARDVPAEGRAAALQLAARAHDSADEVFTALESAPSTPDWENLISQGAVPALALGAERRLRR